MGGFSRKYVVTRLHVPFVWLVQHGVNLTHREVSSLKEVGFLFDSKWCTNLQSLFKVEPSTSSNFQAPSTCGLDVIRLVDVSNWPTSHCGKKVRRPLVFKLMHQHTNNWDVNKLFIPSFGLPQVDVHPLGYG